MHLVNKVLECLRAAAPASLDAAEVAAGCGVDLATDGEVAVLVATNPKAVVRDGRYCYRAAFSCTNAEEVRELLLSRPEGTGHKALSEAYPGAAAAAEELAAEGVVWCIDNKELVDKTYFPRDKQVELEVDEELRRIWGRMEVPTDPQLLEAELRRCGIVAAPRSFVRPTREAAGGRKGKRKRDFSKLHVTNVHLWEQLFAPGAVAAFEEEE